MGAEAGSITHSENPPQTPCEDRYAHFKEVQELPPSHAANKGWSQDSKPGVIFRAHALTMDKGPIVKVGLLPWA